MPMVDKIIEVNWYETPKLGIGASQPHLKQKKCASRQEGAIFVMESKDIEETDRHSASMISSACTPGIRKSKGAGPKPRALLSHRV